MRRPYKNGLSKRRAALKWGALTMVETVNAKNGAIATFTDPTVGTQAINAKSCKDTRKRYGPNGRHNQSTGCTRKKPR